MSQAVLPQRVNTRKALGREASYRGTLGASQLTDFASVLDDSDESGEASIEAGISFGRDEEQRPVIDVSLEARVRLECQRCLEQFTQRLSSRSRLGIVLTDEQAKQLPRDYEPLISAEETDLWAVVAEELALALPVVAYHPEGQCRVGGDAAERKEIETGGDERANPFGILSVLLDEAAADVSKK